jgi:hypothetical protein
MDVFITASWSHALIREYNQSLLLRAVMYLTRYVSEPAVRVTRLAPDAHFERSSTGTVWPTQLFSMSLYRN